MNRSDLLNQRGKSASIMAWLVYGAVCALLGMVISGWASIQKIGDGLILGNGYISAYDSDWVCPNMTHSNLYSGAMSCKWSGERTLPDNYMLAYIISADDSTKFQYITIKFRVSDDNLNYYLLTNIVAGSDITIDIDRYANGSKVADVSSYTVVGGYNNTTFFALILNGSSIKVYTGTGTGMTNRINVTDANIPTGSLIIENTTGEIGGSVDAYGHKNRRWFNLYQSPTVTVNGLDATNQWAMLCKSDGTTKVVSAAQSSGVATIDLSSYFPPVGDGVDWRYLKIGTSDSCSTGIVDTLELYGFMAGDTYTFRNGGYLSYGGRLSNVTNSAATVWVRGNSAVNYTVEAQICNSGLWNISSNYGTLSSSLDYTASTTLTGLSANTCYDYRIKLGGNTQTASDGNQQWSFVTKPSIGTSGNYKIAWYCCQTSGKMPFYGFDVISSLNPDVVIGTGDYYYESEPEWEPIADTQSEMRTKYQQSMVDIRYGNLMHSKNFLYMWDDHEIANDYGNNTWCYSNTMNCYDATSIYTAANSAYNEYVQPSNPDYFTGISGEKDYVYRIGDIDIFVWDLMSYRDAVNINDEIYPYYGQGQTEMILYGGMENCTANEPDNWTSSNTTYTGCSTASKYSGTNGAEVNGAGGGSNYLVQSISTVSGYTYRASIWMNRSAAGSDIPRLNIGTTSCGTEIHTSNNTTTTWTNYTYEWVAPSNQTVYVCLKANDDGSGAAYFDDVSVLEIRPEIKPSCSASNGGSTITCTGTTFNSESPSLSSTETTAQYEGRMYPISSWTDTVLTLTSGYTILCTTCGSQSTRIWKQGKTMLGRNQLIRQLNALRDSSAKYRLIVSTKALMTGWNGDNWNGGCTDGTCTTTARTGYKTERDFIRDYLNDHIKDANKGLSIIACDSHSSAMMNDVYGWVEIMPSSIAAPSMHPIANWNNGVSRAVQGPRMFGYLDVDTTSTPPIETFKIMDENGRVQIGESPYNYKYNGGNVRNNSANHNIELTTRQIATTYYGGETSLYIKVRYAKSTSGYTIGDSIVSWNLGALGNVTAMPAITANTGQTSLWVVYPKCVTTSADSKVCVRNVGVSGSTLSDNGETNIYDFGTGYTIGNLDININSDGYIFVGVEVIRNSDSYKSVVILKSPNVDSLSGTWVATTLKNYINTTENGVSVINMGNKRVGSSWYGAYSVYDGNTGRYRGTNGGIGTLLGSGTLLGGDNITDNPFVSSSGNSDMYITYRNTANSIYYSKLNDTLFNDANLVLWSGLHNATTPQNELSPNALSGTVSGSPVTGAGKFGNGINFDGTDDLVSYADAAVLDITSSFFLSAWVDPTTDAVFDEIAGKWDSGTSNKSYRMYRDTDNKVKCRLSSDGVTNSITLASLTSVLAADGLVWVACMFDDTANTVYVYINNASTADNSVAYTSGIFSGTAPLRIANDVGGSSWWTGVIDEVVLFSRTLNATERQNIKDNMMTNFVVTAQPGTSPSLIPLSGKLYLSYIEKDSSKFRIYQTSSLNPASGTDFTEFTNFNYDTNLLLKRVNLIRGVYDGNLYIDIAKYGAIGSISGLIGNYGYNYSLNKVTLSKSVAPNYYISEGKWLDYYYH